MTPLRLSGAALLAACALAATGCGGASSASEVSGEPISFEELAQSASTSAASTSGRFSFDMSASLGGADDFSLSGEGAFDASSGRSSLALDMSSLAKILGGLVAGLGGTTPDGLPDFDDPKGWKVEVVQDGRVGYVRLPAIADRLPDGKTWVKGAAREIKVGGFDFQQLESFTRSDPRDVLEALRGVGGEIETVGTEELRGVETTHYRALVDPAQLAKAKDLEGRSAPESLVDQLTTQSGLGDVPLDVWIDANGLVRKLTMAFSAKVPTTAASGDATMSFELWDYGEPVEIAVPPASEVANASALRG